MAELLRRKPNPLMLSLPNIVPAYSKVSRHLDSEVPMRELFQAHINPLDNEGNMSALGGVNFQPWPSAQVVGTAVRCRSS